MRPKDLRKYAQDHHLVELLAYYQTIHLLFEGGHNRVIGVATLSMREDVIFF